MKLNVKRVFALVLAMLLMVGCFTGCKYADETNDSNTVAMIIDGENYYMDEFKLYTYCAQYELEDVYAIMILYYYGGYDSFWAQDWSEALSKAATQLYQTKKLVKYAAENGISLSEEEKTKITTAVSDFKEKQSVVLKYSEASDELLEKYFTENALANKAYMELVKGVDKEFDKETFRRKKVEGITVTALTEPPVSEEETEEAAAEKDESEDTAAEEAGEQGEVGVAAAPAGNEAEANEAAEAKADEASDEANADDAEEETTEEETADNSYTEEERETFRKEAMEAIEARMKAGEALSDIVSSYADSEKVSVSELNTTTFTPDDAVEEGGDITSYKQQAWSMATGDYYAGVLVDSDADEEVGYCLHCVSDDDPELRKEAEDEELAKREAALFAEKFAEITKTTKEFHIYDEKVVSKVRYMGQIHEALTVNGDDMSELESIENAEKENAGNEEDENSDEKKEDAEEVKD